MENESNKLFATVLVISCKSSATQGSLSYQITRPIKSYITVILKAQERCELKLVKGSDNKIKLDPVLDCLLIIDLLNPSLRDVLY